MLRAVMSPVRLPSLLTVAQDWLALKGLLVTLILNQEPQVYSETI